MLKNVKCVSMPNSILVIFLTDQLLDFCITNGEMILIS